MKKQILKQKIEENLSSYIEKIELLNKNEIHIVIDNKNITEAISKLHLDVGLELVSMFANDERELKNGSFAIYYIFAHSESDSFVQIKTLVNEDGNFPSISGVIHVAAAYEREIHDLFGLTAIGHSDLKRLVFHGNWPEGYFPLRKDYDKTFKPPFDNKEDSFLEVYGDGVYEIPVGPVHAGTIEPGHFRFSVAGEPVINLEAKLYFSHRGVEKLSEGMDINRCFYLSERISGDESFSNSLAYCQAIEKIAGIKLPKRALLTRVVFAELERLTSHLGDLAGICLDVAFGFAMSQFRLLRGWSYFLADELCGVRFLRSVNTPGGVRKDFLAGKEKRALEKLDKISKELSDTIKIIKSKALFIDRMENTGVLKSEVAKDFHATGPAGRATGICYDVRKSFPYAAYDMLDFSIPEHKNGDINCLMNVKIDECIESISIMRQAIKCMEKGEVSMDIGKLPTYACATGCTESPRGENVHWVMTGENNTIFRYKVRTPSFCNWPALCYAVKGNTVTDFPLINKSFNLSYAGNDL